MPYKYQEESIFNMALAYLKRIDRLLTLSTMHCMNNNIRGWSTSLVSLLRELSVKLTEEEYDKIDGTEVTLHEVKKNDIKREDCTMKNVNALINNPISFHNNKKEILYMMHHIEIKMRRQMQKKGMLLPSKDDPSKAITRF